LVLAVNVSLCSCPDIGFREASLNRWWQNARWSPGSVGSLGSGLLEVLPPPCTDAVLLLKMISWLPEYCNEDVTLHSDTLPQ
jgi:hypothetical protein